MKTRQISLGIDLGTTKVAVVLVDAGTRHLLASHSRAHNAKLKSSDGFFEQNTASILRVAEKCLGELPPGLRRKVSVVGITGQMHGALLWSPDRVDTGPLVTWQDHRASLTGFLPSMQKQLGDKGLRDGFGSVTLAWQKINQPELFTRYCRASTIADYLAARICGLDRAITDPANAASWGLFDLEACRWKSRIWKNLSIPESVFPKIGETGAVAGRLSPHFARKWKLTAGIPVCVPTGDNQASVYAAIGKRRDAISLTIGTGGQISVPLSRTARLALPQGARHEIRPYAGGCCMAVGASLTGGLAFAWLVDSLTGWLKELGVRPPSRDELFLKLDKLALSHRDSPLQVCPGLLGERYQPDMRGAISGLEISNFSLGNLSSALARGLLEHLREMLPREYFRGKKVIIGSGNGLRRLKILRELVEPVFGLPLEVGSQIEEAATGAALLAWDSTIK